MTVSTPVVTPEERRPIEHAPTRKLSEIQGLRAIAVGAVVLYHLWPKRLTGGYVGVDVFFVISGFLITAHLLREVERQGRVRLATFWARRARRLLPASLLVLATSVVATLIWVPSALWQQFLRSAGAAALYVLNWVLARDAVDYLAADNVATPSQHYWSLSVEEQFYLVWPLLIVVALWLAARGLRRRLVVVGALLTLVTGASLLWSLHLTQVDPSTAYFATTTRAWQFGAGGLLALVLAHPRALAAADRAPRLRAGASWIGLALIAYAAVEFTSTTPFPGTAAIVPVAGVVAVIAAGAPAVPWSPTRLLAVRPVQWVGDVSYSTYLWHWPPIVILPYALGHAPGWRVKLVLLAAVLVLAWATTRFVEDPVRKTARFGLRRPAVTFGWTLAAMAVVVAACAGGTVVARGDARAAAERADQIAQDQAHCFGARSMDPALPECPNAALVGTVVPAPKLASDDVSGPDRCWGDKTSKLKTCSFPASGTPDPSVPHVALVGDSHARVWLAAFMALADEGKITLDTYLKSACTWSDTPPDLKPDSSNAVCDEWRQKLQARLLENPDEYDYVVTAGYARQHQKVPSGEDPDAVRVQGLVDAWRPIVDAGGKVIAIHDTPFPGPKPRACVEQSDGAAIARCGRDRADAFSEPDPQVKAVTDLRSGAALVDLTDMFCTDTWCPAVIGGVNVYRDDHHATATYSTTLAPYLWTRLQKAMSSLG